MRRRGPEHAGRIELTAEPTAPRAARAWVMRSLADVGIGGSANQIAELLTAELVANAVVHGEGQVLVDLAVTGACVEIGVTDAGAGQPAVQHPELPAQSGRGLALVEALASTWGTAPCATGKRVWFELTTDD